MTTAYLSCTPSTLSALAALTSVESESGTYSHVYISEAGNQGTYDYDPTSTATPNGVTVILPSDSPSTGRWLLGVGIHQIYERPTSATFAGPIFATNGVVQFDLGLAPGDNDFHIRQSLDGSTFTDVFHLVAGNSPSPAAQLYSGLQITGYMGGNFNASRPDGQLELVSEMGKHCQFVFSMIDPNEEATVTSMFMSSAAHWTEMSSINTRLVSGINVEATFCGAIVLAALSGDHGEPCGTIVFGNNSVLQCAGVAGVDPPWNHPPNDNFVRNYGYASIDGGVIIGAPSAPYTFQGGTILEAHGGVWFTGGLLQVGTASFGSSQQHRIYRDGPNNLSLIIANTDTTNGGVVEYDSYSTAATSWNFVSAYSDVGTTPSLRFKVDGTGAVYNVTGTYGTLPSQADTKQDIRPANSQLADVRALGKKLVNYRLKEDVAANDDAITILNLLAEDVEAISPGCVRLVPRPKTPHSLHDSEKEQGEPEMVKAVLTSVIFLKNLGATAELADAVEDLEKRIAALEAA